MHLSVKNSDDGPGLSGTGYIEALRSNLQLHAALGIDTYPLNQSLRRFFSLSGRRKESRGAGEINLQSKLDLLREEIVGCSRCHFAQNKAGSIFGSGSPSSFLMIVGDRSWQTDEDFAGETLFGREEDVMLWNMMTAIDLNPEDVYVTNCLKCCPKGEVEPDWECGITCFSYLQHEISFVRPRIICAMGEIAAGLLTGRREPLARLRGKFMQYHNQGNTEILVIPTYHPRFLLRHQEMKKAAWFDLQAIRRKMAGK
jgi:uracil-DNA glycosylase family 4